MIETILGWLKDLPKELIVIIVSALPISEVRGGIPLALYFGMPLWKAFWISALGNFLPIIPVLFFLEPISNWLRRIKVFARFFDWLFKRTMKKADTIQKYETLGLAIFIAIPLPMTGAWTGAMAASLLKMRFRYALIGVIAGILGAATIVSILCMFGILSWEALNK